MLTYKEYHEIKKYVDSGNVEGLVAYCKRKKRIEGVDLAGRTLYGILLSGDIETAKEIIKEHRQEYYLNVIKEELVEFFKVHVDKYRSPKPFYSYCGEESDSLVLCNGYSFVTLDSKVEVPKSIKRKRNDDSEVVSKAIERAGEMENQCVYEVDLEKTKEVDKKDYRNAENKECLTVKKDDGSFEKSMLLVFDKRYLSRAKALLGDPTDLTCRANYDAEYPMCLISSPNGRALVLGYDYTGLIPRKG